jgi:hypothetical protein
MIAEFANYHSWIAWVPIVAPLVAGVLVFRAIGSEIRAARFGPIHR